MKKYNVIVFSRQQFATNTYRAEGNSAKEVTERWVSIVKEHLKSLFVDDVEEDYQDEPEEVREKQLQKVVNRCFDDGEYYLVCVVDASAEFEPGNL